MIKKSRIDPLTSEFSASSVLLDGNLHIRGKRLWEKQREESDIYPYSVSRRVMRDDSGN